MVLVCAFALAAQPGQNVFATYILSKKSLGVKALYNIFWLFYCQTNTFSECRLNYFLNSLLSIDVSVNHTADMFLITSSLKAFTP
jgi:hypothetical protein